MSHLVGNTEDNHPLKEVLGKDEVDKIIFMPFFDLKVFECILRTMVAGYDKNADKFVIQ